MEKALPLAAAARRKRELEEIERVLEASPAKAVVGADLAIEALEDARVDTLYAAAVLEEAAWECSICGLLTRHSAVCPRCGRAARAVDLREAAMNQAGRTGARVQVVQGKAADKLQSFGGLAASLRY
jgi:peptide subunit release factor 1 (eRF1)